MLPRPARWAPSVTVLSELLILHVVAEEACVQLIKHSTMRWKWMNTGDRIIPFLCTLQYTCNCWHEHEGLRIHLYGSQAAWSGIKVGVAKSLQMQWTDAVWTVLDTLTAMYVCLYCPHYIYTCMYVICSRMICPLYPIWIKTWQTDGHEKLLLNPAPYIGNH